MLDEFLDAFTRASKSVRAVMDAALRTHGLHLGQNLVLAALWESDGQTPGAIAAATDVTTPTIVKMANRMTAAGLLTRRRDDRDNRLVRLYLTDAGRALYEPMQDDLRALEQRLTAGMGEPEVRRLMTSLSRLTENAHALGDEPAPAGDETD